jgi:hypothetical protein
VPSRLPQQRRWFERRCCFYLRLSHKSDARDRPLFRGMIFVAIGIQKASDRLISEVELATPVDHRLMRQPRLDAVAPLRTFRTPAALPLIVQLSSDRPSIRCAETAPFPRSKSLILGAGSSSTPSVSSSTDRRARLFYKADVRDCRLVTPVAGL